GVLLCCSSLASMLCSSLHISYGIFYVFFFFFQAEDGIRDWSVTGVQTCALPISGCSRRGRSRGRCHQACRRSAAPDRGSSSCPRSEERRVGKECRSRGWPYD